MELLPLGGNSASPQPPTQPETSATPTPAAVPQTPPYASTSAAPTPETNPWRAAAAPTAQQPTPSYEAPRNEKSSSSGPTLGAIALVVLSLGAGVLRAYNRQQMREERRMEQTRQQQGYDADAEAVRQQSAAIRAANAERGNYNLSTRPNFPPPNPTRVGFPPSSDKGGNDPLAPPSPRMRALLLNEAGQAGNGRTVARSVISATGNGVYHATVTYNTGDVAQFVYDGSVWTREGGSAPPPNSGGTAAFSGGAQAGQPGQPSQMGQHAQSGQTYGGNGSGYSQPMNGAATGSGGQSTYNGTGSGNANPVNGGAPASGTSAASGGFNGAGSVPQNTGQNPASGGANPSETNPPASNPDPGTPPAGG